MSKNSVILVQPCHPKILILDETVLIPATKALWSLCVNELNASIATAEKAFKGFFTIYTLRRATLIILQ